MEANAMNNNNMPNGAIPLGLRYNLSVSPAVDATRVVRNFQAENPSTFTPTNNVVRIPVSSSNFLDLRNAVLGFDLKNSTSTDPQFLDGGASCVIQRLRILSNGVELERIEQYNLLSSILDQYAGSSTSMNSDDVLKGSPARMDNSPFMLAGDGTGGTNTATGANGLVVAAAAGGAMSITNANGGKGYDQKQACRLNTGITRHFEIPLRASGWFNSTAGKLLPMNTNFVCELTLAPAVQAFARVSGTSTQDYECSNFQLNIPDIMVRDPAFNAAVMARLAQGSSWSATSYQHHVNTSTGSAGRDVLQLAARCTDLKGLMSVLRKQSNIGAAAQFQNSRRSIQYVNQFQYQLGSQQLPPQLVDISTDVTAGGTAAKSRIAIPATSDLNISEAYVEVERLFGNLGSQSGATNVIGAEPFAQSELNNGCGLIAIDTSAFSDGSVSSGIDTRSNSLPVQLIINKTAAANATIQIDSYAVHGVKYMRDSAGNMSVLY